MGLGFETRRTGRWGFIIVVDVGGGFIFISEAPDSSTQFLLRVGRATRPTLTNCGGASGAVSEEGLWRFAGQMGQCVPRLCRLILAD